MFLKSGKWLVEYDSINRNLKINTYGELSTTLSLGDITEEDAVKLSKMFREIASRMKQNRNVPQG